MARRNIHARVIPTAVIATVILGVGDALLPNQQADNPQWGGTLTNAARHWTGVVFPTSQSLANALGWEVFDEYVPDPYTSFTYESRELDTGADNRQVLQVYYESRLGPGEAGSAVASAQQADHKLAAGAYDGFESWPFAATATFRQAKGKLTFTAADGLVVLERMILAYKVV